MAFVGNDILLSSRMLANAAPITIKQDGSTGKVTLGLSYSSQFILDGSTGKLTITSIDPGVVTGLSAFITNSENSFSTIATQLDGIETIKTTVTALNTTVTGLSTDVTNLKSRIDTLESGSVDLSDYTATNGIKLTANGANGIQFITKNSSATVTINGSPILTGADMSGYQLVSDKNKANGYAGLDANSKLTVSQLPIDGTTLVVSGSNIAVNPLKVAVLDSSNLISATQVPVGDGLKVSNNKVIVDTSKVVTLNTSGKIDSSMIDTINIQECYSANVTSAGAITILTSGVTLADVDVGDAIIINQGAGDYVTGSFYYRSAKSKNDIRDFVPMSRDITAATQAQVTAGTATGVYISPAALKGSAPSLVGTNFSDIPGTAVAVATNTTRGAVVITVGNGLNLNSGVVSVSQASTSSYGTVKVTSGNGLAINSGVLSLSVATASTAGSVILNGKGIAVGSNGSFDVALVIDSNTLSGTGGTTALSVKLPSTGALKATTNGIELQIDTTLLAIEGNKLVNKAVSVSAMNTAISTAVSGLRKKQSDIQIVANTNYNASNGSITITATEHPKGIYKVGGSFFAISPESRAAGNDGSYTYVINVNGFTALNSGTWYVAF